MKKIIFSTIALVLLAACSNKFKKTIGMTTTAPDEFQVKSARPLEMPPHYDLKEPGNIADDAAKDKN